MRRAMLIALLIGIAQSTRNLGQKQSLILNGQKLALIEKQVQYIDNVQLNGEQEIQEEVIQELNVIQIEEEAVISIDEEQTLNRKEYESMKKQTFEIIIKFKEISIKNLITIARNYFLLLILKSINQNVKDKNVQIIKYSNNFYNLAKISSIQYLLVNHYILLQFVNILINYIKIQDLVKNNTISQNNVYLNFQINQVQINNMTIIQLSTIIDNWRYLSISQRKLMNFQNNYE